MTDQSRDKLTETTDQGKIELREEELNRVSGGNKAGKPVEFLKIRLTDVLVAS